MALGPFQKEILRWAPNTWIGKETTGALLESFGAALDSAAERVFRGRLAAIVHSGGAKTAGGIVMQCEPEVLAWHARDRQIKLYETEPLESKRVRLATWRQLHARRGTHKGEIENVRPYFLGADGSGSVPTIYIVHRKASRTTWHRYTGAGVYTVHKGVDNFDYAPGDDASWAQWFAIIEMTQTDYTAPNTYDDGHTYDDGEVYDAGGANPLSAQACADIVDMFESWKSAHSWLTAVILNWGAPIDITASPVQDADGWWSLPNAKWWLPYDPSDGNRWTRPPYMQWIRDTLP